MPRNSIIMCAVDAYSTVQWWWWESSLPPCWLHQDKSWQYQIHFEPLAIQFTSEFLEISCFPGYRHPKLVCLVKVAWVNRLETTATARFSDASSSLKRLPSRPIQPEKILLKVIRWIENFANVSWGITLSGDSEIKHKFPFQEILPWMLLGKNP